MHEIQKHEKLSSGDMIYALEMAIACAISYWIITYILAPFVGNALDLLGAMRAVVATVFVAAISPQDAREQPLLRLVDTVVGIAVGVDMRKVSLLFVRKQTQ